MKKLTVRLCLFFLLAAGVLTPVWQSHAFVTFGIMAQFHTQQFWVNPNFNNVKDPNAGTAAQQTTALQNGAFDWNGNADYLFTYGGQTAIAAVNNADGVNAVFYSDNVGDPMFGALAICFLWADAKNFITAFDIEYYDFNGQTLNDFVYFWLPAPALPAFNEFDIWGIATHEFGHALGLDHTQLADGTISMFPQIAPGAIVQRTLHVDDVNGVQAIYGPPPFVAKFAGVQVFCPPNFNVQVGAPTPIGGWTITNTGNIPDCFNWVLTDAGAGVLVGDPVVGQTPLLQPGQVFNVPQQTAQFNCVGGLPPAPTPLNLTATSVGNPAVLQACGSIMNPVGGNAIPQAKTATSTNCKPVRVRCCNRFQV